MINAIVKMYNLQELIRKVYLGGLINNAVIQFKDNIMQIEAIGIEDKEGFVDSSLTTNIKYPCETIEGGIAGINDLGTFLISLETFERDDVVQVNTTESSIIITRSSEPPQSINFDLVDIKYVKTYATGQKVVFGTPIRIIRSDGKEKSITFDACAVIDAQKLKDHGAKVDKIEIKNMPMSIKDGKLITVVKAEIVELKREVAGVTSITGTASATYPKNLLTIIKSGIGTVTLKFSEGSPIHVHFEHESITADYLIQIHEE